MTKLVVVVVVGLVLGLALFLSPAAGAQGPLVPFGNGGQTLTTPRWPAVTEQLARDGVLPGSALETLIRANQDFSRLRPGEADDDNPIPPWLRVLWHKSHPEGRYSATDPTGGYPLLLREIHEWMLRHQDLVPGRPAGPERERAAPTAMGEERISGASTGPRSESAIRVNPFDPSKIIAASNDIGGGEQAIYSSTDGGRTWSQSSLPLGSEDLFQSDPTVEWTSDGTAWSLPIAITALFTLQLRAYKSTDNGLTWTADATVSGSNRQSDKEMTWVDHSAGSPFKDNLYAIWHDNFWVLMARRTGSTGRWQNPVLVSGPETTGTGIGGDVTTNSAGDVFGFWPDTDSRQIYLVKSTDGGVTYSPARRIASTFGSFQVSIPADNLRRALIYVSAAAYKTAGKNNVYATWNDLSGESGCAAFFVNPGANAASRCKTRIWFTRSTDGGTTWSPPNKIYDPGLRNDQFFQWLTVDEATGRLGIIYFDTKADPSRLSTRLYYQSSDDDGTTWSVPFQVTSASTNETLAGADFGNQFGDYNSLSGAAGVLFPTWTDRRSGNREEIWTAAITDAGGCSGPAVSSLTATPKGTSGVALAWSSVAGATYQVFRATTSGGPYSLVATATVNSYFDAAGPCDSTRYYAVRTATGCAAALSNEVSFANRSSAVLYSNDFEANTGHLSDWAVGTLANVGPTTDWFGLQSCLAHGGQHSFRFGSPDCTGGAVPGDFLSAVPGGVNGIAVPAGASFTQVSFWHAFNFARGQGGGTLGFSLDGGVTDFLIPKQSLVGETFNPIGFSSCRLGGNPIGVFTGTSSGFVHTTVDLDSNCTFAGAPGCGGVQLAIAFLGMTQCGSPPQNGWYLDDVLVTTCLAPTPPALDFYSLPPCRLVDTRNPAGPLGGPALAPQSARAFALAGSCGVPVTARALSVNVTVVNAAAAGQINLYADDSAPSTSVLSFSAGQVRANSALLALGNGSGAIQVANGAAGTVDFLLDVNGYFQ